MASQVGPLDTCSDVPPDGVVRGCERLGFHRPLDVPWHHHAVMARVSRLCRELDEPV